MNAERAIFALNVVQEQFWRILGPLSSIVIDQARAEIRTSWELTQQDIRRRVPPRAWGFAISSGRPLEFRECIIKDAFLQVDLFCDFRWSGDEAADLPVKQELVLRVWTLDPEVAFRPNLDSEEVKVRLALQNRRVMLRYHFDLSNAGQDGPKYHLQAGGNARDEEICWLHEAISIPRIAHPPMDLVLACEMVAANFFLDEARPILEDAIWRGVVRDSQNCLLGRYYSDCLKAVANGESLLAHLWNDR